MTPYLVQEEYSQLESPTAPAVFVPDTRGEQEVAIIFGSRTVMLVSGVLTQSLLAYTLLPEGRGAYAVCITFAVFLSLLALSADQGARYLVMTKQMSVSQGVVLVLTTVLAASLLAAVLVLPLIHSDIALFKKAEIRSFYLALALIPLMSMTMAADIMLAGLRRFGRLAVFLLLQSLVNMVAIATLVWGWGLGVDGAILSLIIADSVMVAASLWDLRRHCGLTWEMPSRTGLRRVLAFGLKYHIARIGSYFDTRLGVLFLAFFATNADIGLIAVASVFSYSFMIISDSVGRALYPRVAADPRGKSEQCALCLRLVCLTTGSALLALVAASTPMVRLLLSETFLPAVPLIWIMVPGVLADAAAGMFRTYFLGTNRPGICSWAVSIGLCANIVALLLLYPPFGVEGAAWALTLSMFCRMVYFTIVFHRTTHMSMTSTWLPQRGDIAYLWTRSRFMIVHNIGRKAPSVKNPKVDGCEL